MRLFASSPFAAPVATARFAVPFGPPFPFCAIGGDRSAFGDGLTFFSRWKSVNDRHDLGCAAYRTATRFVLLGFFFHEARDVFADCVDGNTYKVFRTVCATSTRNR